MTPLAKAIIDTFEKTIFSTPAQLQGNHNGPMRAEIEYTIELDWPRIRAQVLKALKSKNHRSTAGPVTVRIASITPSPRT
jgi:hypothetical protein